ncbi:hypothetical protein ACER0C_024898 [Sarotherodon galilaeus]
MTPIWSQFTRPTVHLHHYSTCSTLRAGQKESMFRIFSVCIQRVPVVSLGVYSSESKRAEYLELLMVQRH